MERCPSCSFDRLPTEQHPLERYIIRATANFTQAQRLHVSTRIPLPAIQQNVQTSQSAAPPNLQIFRCQQSFHRDQIGSAYSACLSAVAACFGLMWNCSGRHHRVDLYTESACRGSSEAHGRLQSSNCGLLLELVNPGLASSNKSHAYQARQNAQAPFLRAVSYICQSSKSMLLGQAL